MWKRILLAAGLIALCVTLIILCNVFLYRSADVLISGVDDCLNMTESEQFVQRLSEVSEEYFSRRTYLSLMMNNRTLDEIDYLVNKLTVLSRDEKTTDIIKETLAALRHQLSRLRDDNYLDIKNIF